MTSPCETSDLLVFSHLRWDFMFQRPHHLLSRHARYRRVFYVEEPVLGMTEIPRLHLKETAENVVVVVPYLPANTVPEQVEVHLTDLMEELVYEEEIIDYTLWYYSPQALSFTRHLVPQAIIFDYTDEIACRINGNGVEAELMEKADLVFTSGPSLYEAKKSSHHNIHSFPCSVDYPHFSQARMKLTEPDDQINIPRPRVGFYGILDERFHFDLLLKMAELRPEYQFVIVGPHVSVDISTFPKRGNIHYLGKKDYYALPLYLAGWDCVIIPSLLNDSTRFITPAKTSEILAAGKPIVSTRIQDVMYPFAMKNLVHIADSAEDFVAALEGAMAQKKDPEWLDRVDHFLKEHSWDLTFEKMAKLESETLQRLLAPHGPEFGHSINLSASGAI